MTQKIAICHDCGVSEGEIHLRGCDSEKCPFCGGQLIACDCCYKKVGLKPDSNKRYHGLPREIYKHGLPAHLSRKFERILNKKGRIPYIRYPNLCARCGKKNPEMVMYPDWEWERYIEIGERDKIICDPCFQEIKKMIDKKANLPPIELVPCPFCDGKGHVVIQHCSECRGRGVMDKRSLPEQIRKFKAWRKECKKFERIYEASKK